MSNQKIVTEAALSAIASDIKTALLGKANSNDVYTKTEIDNALELKADKSELYNVYPTEQESGAIVHITDGADNIPVKSLVSQIVAVESGNGQPKSPDNPYTISGFSQGVITRCGVNIFDEEMEVGTLNNSTGETEIDGNKMRSVNFISVKPNTTYSVYNNTGVNLYIYSYGVDKSFIDFDNTPMVTGSTFTTDSNTHYIKFRTQNNPSYSNNISINYPSTDTSYHAYNGTTYTFEFGQTVYGGSADIDGSGENTHKKVDLGSLTWNKITVSGHTLFYTNVISDKAQNFNFLCEIYKVVEAGRGDLNNEEIGCFNTTSAMNILCIRDDRKASLSESDFATAIIGKYVCYEMTSPQAITFEPVSIPTLLGENNIYSNTGDVKVDYHADIGLYIDKKISSLAQG